MKLPIKWLKESVDTRLSPEKIADMLTMAGLEVDEIVHGHSFSGVVVGHVLSVEKHPNATRLNVATVDIGAEKLQIVCGATNLEKGQKVAVAIVGAKLGEYEISKASLRGVDSFGMICSEKELGLGDDHEGIMILETSQKIGEVYVSEKGADTVLDVKVLANRPDCMSVIGLANEVAVVTGSKLSIPAIKISEAGTPVEFSVKVENEKLCPRYMARFVTGLEAGRQKLKSPKWMKERLQACGVRPISLFVDISNYVMLEYGQPLHFFDLDKLTDKRIAVRPAKTGEVLTTLDGVNRKLTSDNLVIADFKKPIALAGVMGGLDTEIDDNTTNILIEAAIFDKASIRRTSRAMGLRSEAVARFEKGIAPMLPEVAINRAVELLQTLGKGKISKTIIDEYPSPEKPKNITLDVVAMNKFLGTDISESDASTILKSLGFEISKSAKSISVTPPFWRVDIAEAVDIYEEVIRAYGYDKVPYTLPFDVPSVSTPSQYHKLVGSIRSRLSALGFAEILTYSFIGKKELESLGVSASIAPEVQNPLVSDQQYLRPTLAPKMLEALRDNQYHKAVLKFFEIGRSFVKTKEGQLPEETNWLTLGTNTDFYDVKGVVYNLLAGLQIYEDEIVVKATSADYLKKGMGAELFFRGKKLVTLGEVREEVKGKFDINKSATVALVNIDTLLDFDIPETKFVQFSKYQLVTRDISAVFDNSKTIAEIRQRLSRASKLVKGLEIVDIYSGKGLAATERSVTIRFSIQADDHTLTEAEVDDVMKLITSKIVEFGGRIRSGNKA